MVESRTLETLDLSAGTYLRGIPLGNRGSVGQHMFLAATDFAQLKGVTRDPMQLQPGTKRTAFSEDLEHEVSIHELIQRAMKDAKRANVPKYRQYIEDLVAGRRDGVLPPLHLWAEVQLEVVEYGGKQYLLLPNDLYLLALDAETQLTAHYRIDTHDSAIDPEIRQKHKRFPLAAVVHHGVAVRSARQYFHDLNVLAVRPNTSLGLAMDAQDPLIRLVEQLEVDVTFLTGRVDKQSRQLTKASSKVLTLQALRQVVINIAKGMAGIQYGARPVPVEGLDLDELHDVARDWLNDLCNTFGTKIADRENYLISISPVLSAIGAMGHRLLEVDATHRQTLRAEMISGLQSVDWKKGEHWVGIAGKINEKGKFVAGGTKEVAYAVFNVLTNPDQDGYRRVRHRQQVPVAV